MKLSRKKPKKYAVKYQTITEVKNNCDVPHSLDDGKTRKILWSIIASGKSIPTVQKNAVEKGNGILDSFFGESIMSDKDFKKMMEEALDE